jgi:hypothetical protein
MPRWYSLAFASWRVLRSAAQKQVVPFVYLFRDNTILPCALCCRGRGRGHGLVFHFISGPPRGRQNTPNAAALGGRPHTLPVAFEPDVTGEHFFGGFGSIGMLGLPEKFG